MAGRKMRIGIMSKEAYRLRTISIAKGEYRPKKNEPKVWFESMKSLGQVLSGQNQRLLRLTLLTNRSRPR